MQINAINSTINNGAKAKGAPAKNSQPAFKGGVSNAVTDGFSKFYETTAKTKPFQNFVNKFSHANNSFTHLIVAESCFLSGFYMLNTLKNKKIKKEQKPQMLINDTLTLGVSTAGAYLADNKINSWVSKASEKYFTKHGDFYTKLGKKTQEALGTTPKQDLLSKVGEVVEKSGDDIVKGAEEIASTLGGHLKNITGEEGALKAFQVTGEKLQGVKDGVKEAVINNKGNAGKAKEAVEGLVSNLYDSSAARSEADKLLPGIGKLKAVVIFGLIYRYIGPVVITPIANKLSEKLMANKNQKTEETK